ncbi:MAG: Fe-S cluster assembly protein SufD [Verrucomicrobia bacterium]|nr:Fe-S cluster assembly protein SufD [Verrucomicrobiota bacterium]
MLAHLKEQFALLQSHVALSALREKGWRQFETLGMPSKKHEAYRYLPLSRLCQQNFTLAHDAPVSKQEIAKAVDPVAKHSHIVFVNGFFRPDLSDVSALGAQVQLMALSDAMRSHGSFLNNRLSKAIAEEKDPFAALNAAVHGEGIFLYVPPKIVLNDPIQCIYVHAHENEEMLSSPRLHLFLGKDADVKWITTSLGSGNVNGILDAALEEGAHLRLFNQIAPSQDRWHFESVRATLKKGSRLHSVSTSSGKGCARQDYRVLLAGEGAEAQLLGLTALQDKAQSHAHLLVEHAAPHTQSMQRFKTLLDNISQSSFEGKIFVRKEAQKTQAYQLNNNLLLDDRAIANSKPNLEIFADDVKASHGVTVSQLDSALLFYLKTRGISEHLAKNLLTAGFCQEILQEIPYPFLAQEIQMQLNAPLNQKGC